MKLSFIKINRVVGKKTGCCNALFFKDQCVVIDNRNTLKKSTL